MPGHVFEAAARHWLHVGSGLHGVAGGPPVNLAAGLFSKIMFLGVVVRQVGSDHASLGNASWCALVWPLRVDGRDEDGTYSWGFEEGGSAEWVFLTNPLSWHTFPHKAIRLNKGIILEQVGAEEPLLKWSLRQAFVSHFRICCVSQVIVVWMVTQAPPETFCLIVWRTILPQAILAMPRQ